MRKSIITLVSAGLLVAFTGSEKQYAAAKDSVANSKAAVPATLIGQWQSGALAAANFYNPSTQQWGEPKGRGMFLILQANGEYRLGAGEAITTTDYYFYQEGTFSINGAEIVLSPRVGSQFERDICVHEEDQHASSKDELQAATLKFQIALDQLDACATTLVLSNENGEQITLQ